MLLFLVKDGGYHPEEIRLSVVLFAADSGGVKIQVRN